MIQDRLEPEPNNNICEAVNCSAQVAITILVKAGDQSVPLSLCNSCISKFEDTARWGRLRFDTKKNDIKMGLPIRSQCHPERLLSFREISGYSSRMIDNSKLSEGNDKSFAYSKKHARKTISVGKRKNIVKCKESTDNSDPWKSRK